MAAKQNDGHKHEPYLTKRGVFCVHCDAAMTTSHIFEVQTGKNKGKYQTWYRFVGNLGAEGQAYLYYRSINTGNGYKKRLLKDGKVIERYIS